MSTTRFQPDFAVIATEMTVINTLWYTIQKEFFLKSFHAGHHKSYEGVEFCCFFFSRYYSRSYAAESPLAPHSPGCRQEHQRTRYHWKLPHQSDQSRNPWASPLPRHLTRHCRASNLSTKYPFVDAYVLIPERLEQSMPQQGQVPDIFLDHKGVEPWVRKTTSCFFLGELFSRKPNLYRPYPSLHSEIFHFHRSTWVQSHTVRV